jgi:transposase-like protein
MVDLGLCFCPNEACRDHGLRGQGNLTRQFAYGVNKDRHMLYCRICKRRFAETRCTAFFGSKFTSAEIGSILRTTAEGVGVRATGRLLGLDKDAVNRVILKAGEHCVKVMENLLVQLDLTEVQLDELWTFLEKKTRPEMRARMAVRSGSGRRSTPRRSSSSVSSSANGTRRADEL